ncbi:MAG TPA: zinc ribbon domain-containing protein [Geobacteraceae bacterium]|nr:zinc ribbon domain-containing protein [Geobacteraceae bacterium]
MPIYEYRCTACEHTFELRQKFSDPPATECPKCRGEVTKLISSSAFALKGGGWHAEGYGNGKKSTDAPACPSGGTCAGCPSAAA